MRTYIAQLIYSIECSGIQTEQYEEQWRLVLGRDEQDALTKARGMAAKEECVFVDRQGRAVQWRLIAVKDLQEIELEDGALLVSTVKEISPVTDPVWIL